MKLSSIILRYTVAFISVKVSATVMLMDDNNNNNMLMGQSLNSFLSGLVQHDQLSEEHKLEIMYMASPPPNDAAKSDTTDIDGNGDSSKNNNVKEHYRDQGFTTAESKELLRDYLYNTVNSGSMEEETAEEIASSLNLGGLFFTEQMVDSLAFMQGLNGAAPANYQGEGNMQRVSNILPVSVGSSSNVNGIWGYATPNGAREYALMCAGVGLSIVDVTDAAKPFRVQFTPMSGGGIWRDTCTHVDETSGITYAYVAAQGKHGGGDKPNLFVFNLSWLSDDPNKPNRKDSNPIPKGDNGYMDVGETGYGHTINCARGLLFLHTADSSDGCRVYDISENPTKPKFLFDTGGTGGCHDSMVQTNVNIGGETKDLWIISEAFLRRDNIRDITAVNSQTKAIPPLLGSTPAMTGIYAHSSVLYKNRYLFQTEENNQHDICIYDIGNIGSPLLISRFQQSEHNALNSITHNGFIRGNYYFNAYYQAGLRVFDISNPHSVYEVGKVETHRDPDGDGKLSSVEKTSFAGAWNVYVDLPSENILVDDMQNGLFIVRASAPYNPPGSPVLTTERDDSGNVKLYWNTGSNVRGYSVERSFDGLTYTRIAEHLTVTSNSFVDNGARKMSTFYRIIAVNGEGEGISNTVYSKVKGEDTAPPTHAPTHIPTHLPTSVVGTPTNPSSNGGPQTASYNDELGVPSCAMGSSCDTLSLLDGRRNVGPEKNQPNTLDNCSDGGGGKYHSDESVDAIFISSNSDEDMKEGSTVTVNAGVFCYSNGKKNFIYFFHTADATNPSWTLKKRVKCTGGGIQTLSTSYQLPKGAIQAVRVSIRYEDGGNSNQGPCGKGNYVDNDDVAIQVKENPGMSIAEKVEVEADVKNPTTDHQPDERDKQHKRGQKKRKKQLRTNGIRQQY